MSSKQFFGIVALIATIQVHRVTSQDPKLEQCIQKFLEQAKKIDFSHLPTCFDANKLSQAETHAKVFGNFFDTLPQECKQPTPGNITKCLKHSFDYFKNHTPEVQAGIAGSINSLFEGAKGCIDVAVKQFSGLDQYIANGCVDK